MRAMSETAPAPDTAPAKAVVLVAEDEVLVRMLIADLVEEAGFRVREASDANEAIRILEARPDVHVLVTDIEMPPGPSGLELAAEVRERWPFVEVIVTSGRMRPGSNDLPASVLFVPKPWTAEGLTRCIQEAVERAHSDGGC